MLELKHITAGYNGIIALEDISLEFEENAVTTIIGPNGSGKSTLLKIATRLMLPTAGSVHLNQTDISKYSRKEIARNISILPQIRSIPNIDVESFVLHGRFPYLSMGRRYGRFDKEIVQYALEQTASFELREKRLTELSGGERQRVYFSMIIAQDTEFVFLDEPTTYLDINYQLEMMKLVQKLKEHGKTVIMVLHDISTALSNSDKIIVLNNKKIQSYDKPETICEQQLIDEVFSVKTEQFKLKQETRYFFSLKE